MSELLRMETVVDTVDHYGDARKHRCRVLIVDDMPDVRAMLAAMLSTVETVEVVGEAEDGEAALNTAQAIQPDVIILDVAMPKKTGLEVLQPLKELPSKPRVIIHSGFDHVIKDSALSAGAHSFLPKGARMDEIIQTVESACGDGCH